MGHFLTDNVKILPYLLCSETTQPTDMVNVESDADLEPTWTT